jgi:hypothetical protein
MKREFDIFNREFFRIFTFSLKFQKKALVSIIYMKKYSVSSTFLYNGCQIGKQMIFHEVSGAAREERYE